MPAAEGQLPHATNRRWRFSVRAVLFVTAVIFAVVVWQGRDAWEKPVSVMKHLHGLTREALIEKFGPPRMETQFQLRYAPYHVQHRLDGEYPLARPESGDVVIKELTWLDGNSWVAVWLHEMDGRWVALDSLRWHKNVKHLAVHEHRRPRLAAFRSRGSYHTPIA